MTRASVIPLARPERAIGSVLIFFGAREETPDKTTVTSRIASAGATSVGA